MVTRSPPSQGAGAREWFPPSCFHLPHPSPPPASGSKRDGCKQGRGCSARGPWRIRGLAAPLTLPTPDADAVYADKTHHPSGSPVTRETVTLTSAKPGAPLTGRTLYPGHPGRTSRKMREHSNLMLRKTCFSPQQLTPHLNGVAIIRPAGGWFWGRTTQLQNPVTPRRARLVLSMVQPAAVLLVRVTAGTQSPGDSPDSAATLFSSTTE